MRVILVAVLVLIAIVSTDGAMWVRRGVHNATDAKLHFRAETNATNYKPDVMCKTCVDFSTFRLRLAGGRANGVGIWRLFLAESAAAPVCATRVEPTS